MAFSRGARVHPEPSSKLLSNFTNGLIASIPKVCDMMIREARNVILCKLSRSVFLSTEMAEKLGGSGQSTHEDTFQVLFRALQEQISAVNEKNETALTDTFGQPV
jgi:hypothetical protein